jgi:hypothetical protein
MRIAEALASFPFVNQADVLTISEKIQRFLLSLTLFSLILVKFCSHEYTNELVIQALPQNWHGLRRFTFTSRSGKKCETLK